MLLHQKVNAASAISTFNEIRGNDIIPMFDQYFAYRAIAAGGFPNWPNKRLDMT